MSRKHHTSITEEQLQELIATKYSKESFDKNAELAEISGKVCFRQRFNIHENNPDRIDYGDFIVVDARPRATKYPVVALRCDTGSECIFNVEDVSGTCKETYFEKNGYEIYGVFNEMFTPLHSYDFMIRKHGSLLSMFCFNAKNQAQLECELLRFDEFIALYNSATKGGNKND